MQAEFLNGTKNRTSGHVQFETCEVYHGVLVLFCRVSLSYSYICFWHLFSRKVMPLVRNIATVYHHLSMTSLSMYVLV